MVRDLFKETGRRACLQRYRQIQFRLTPVTEAKTIQ